MKVGVDEKRGALCCRVILRIHFERRDEESRLLLMSGITLRADLPKASHEVGHVFIIALWRGCRIPIPFLCDRGGAVGLPSISPRSPGISVRDLR